MPAHVTLSFLHTTLLVCPCSMHNRPGLQMFTFSSGHMQPLPSSQQSSLSLTFSSSLPCYIFICRSYHPLKVCYLFMSTCLLSLLLKDKTMRAGPFLSCSCSIPRARTKHTKSVLLNQEFMTNAVIYYYMDSKLSPGSCFARKFIYPGKKDSGSFADEETEISCISEIKM